MSGRVARGFQRRLAALAIAGLVAALGGAAAEASAAGSRQVPTARRTVRAAPGASPAAAIRRTPARRSRAARTRAARRARELAELARPLLREDDQGRLVPVVRAAAAIIYNPQTGEVLWEANGHAPRSIASLTKVMTAIVFLETDPDLDEVVSIARADVRGASTTYLRAAERVTVDELLHLLLIGSDNAAARVLARISPWGPSGFVDQMNAKAAALGLDDTHFADPSGLDPGNISSAYDLSRLIAYAATDDYLAAVMRKPSFTLATKRGPVTVENTNKLLGELSVRSGKTGFIRQAGYCLATLLQLPQGPEVAVVILGARSSLARFFEARHLFNWLSSRAQEFFFGQPGVGPQPR